MDIAILISALILAGLLGLLLDRFALIWLERQSHLPLDGQASPRP